MAKWEGKHDVAALSAELRRRLAPAIAAGAVTEKRMFGGICFLRQGNMLCGAGKNGYMLRVGVEHHAEASRLPAGRPVVMAGRTMAGFFWVDPDAAYAASLTKWLALAENYVGTFPPKAAKTAKARSSAKVAPKRRPPPRQPARRPKSR